MNRRLLGWAAAVFLLFVLWTAVVRIGISEGSRKSVWRTQQFGQWPSEFGAVTGSSDARFSIYVSFDQTLTATAPLGLATIGGVKDTSDAHNMNGTRVKTGARAGPVRAISAYVAAPVQAAPNNQFQMAVYTDKRGAPDKLIGQTETGTLLADAWNTLPLNATLQPKQAYWLLYNTPGSNAQVNNLTYKRAATNPLDLVIRSHKSGLLDDLTYSANLVGNVTPTTLVMLALCAWIGLRRPRLAVALLVVFVAGLLLELVLKRTLFFPYQQYPSGHTLRALFLAVALAQVVPARFVYAAGTGLVIVMGFSVIYTGGHYADEVAGGLLLGLALAMAACGLTTRADQVKPATGAEPIAVGLL